MKNGHKPEELLAWFERFYHQYVEKSIVPEDCYNMDETGFRIGIGKDQWAITKDLKRPMYLLSASNRDLITAVECINAAGNVIAPKLILPGVLHQQAWFKNTNLDDDYLLATSSTGYTNDVLNADWIRHFHRQTVHQQHRA